MAFAYDRFLLRISVIPKDVLFSKGTLVTAAINLSLFHAWSPYKETYMSFCGATWFLSCILFCYFMSPVLIETVKTEKKYWVFKLVFLFRVGLEYLQIRKPGVYFNFSFHCSPFIRCLEYWMGIGIYPWFVLLHKYIKDNTRTLIHSITEVAVFITNMAIIALNPTNLRGFYLIPISLLILVFAFDSGILSTLFRIPVFKALSDISLEIVVFESAIAWAGNRYINLISNIWMRALVFFLTVLVASYTYHHLFKIARSNKTLRA